MSGTASHLPGLWSTAQSLPAGRPLAGTRSSAGISPFFYCNRLAGAAQPLTYRIQASHTTAPTPKIARMMRTISLAASFCWSLSFTGDLSLAGVRRGRGGCLAQEPVHVVVSEFVAQIGFFVVEQFDNFTHQALRVMIVNNQSAMRRRQQVHKLLNNIGCAAAAQ